MDWENRSVLITGGASFIGSHLVDALVEKGASIRVVDDLSSGLLENIQGHIDTERVEFHERDLLVLGVAQEMVKDMDVLFHLAAIHGGRGYIDLHQAKCAQNFIIDGLVIKAAYEAGVGKFVFASSGCVYPVSLQMDVTREVYLTEEMVGPPYEADDTYGWAKLMAEITLKSYYQDYGFKSASCRFFTVYGERCTENHAILAMIARAFLKQDPFEVWGDGTQVRNWTYVGDIVRGMIMAAEKIGDATAINLGTEERIRVIDAVREILHYTGHEAEIKYLLDMPTGPLNRVAGNKLARELLGWEPQVKFIDGLHKTIDWYFSAKDREKTEADFERMLTER
jgi:nucleoside-diphosphate-sugar epimerase